MGFCYTELTTGTCEVTFSGSPRCGGGSGVHRRPTRTSLFAPPNSQSPKTLQPLLPDQCHSSAT